MLSGAAALAATSLLPGCGGSAGSSSSPGTGSGTGPNQQPKPSGSLTSASLTVTTTAAGSIGPAFAGLSYEKSQLYGPLFSGSNASLIGMFKRLGPSVLRVGGNTVDYTHWNPNGAGQTPGEIAPSDVDALAAFVKAAGWQCLYGVNLGGAGPNPYQINSTTTATTTAALAADEAAYAAKAFGSALLGIEIGNEPDLYGGSYFKGTTWNVTTFESLWSQFRAAIVAKTPGIPITGPVDASYVSTWTVPFAQAEGKANITLLTQHYYRANGQSPTSTVDFLITPDSNLVNELATLKSTAQGIGVPFRMAECNSFYNGGAPNVSDSYASALWVIDYLFNCAQASCAGVNFHGGGSGTGYTPIANSGSVVIEARPEFYGMLLFTLAGQGTLYATQLSVGSLNATAYAVKSASGGLNIIVVNKDSTQNLQLTIQLPQSATSATLMQMTQATTSTSGPSLSATEGVTIQGASVSNSGAFTPGTPYVLSPSGSQLSCYVPYLSAVLIQVS